MFDIISNNKKQPASITPRPSKDWDRLNSRSPFRRKIEDTSRQPSDNSRSLSRSASFNDLEVSYWAGKKIIKRKDSSPNNFNTHALPSPARSKMSS